jgi:hypothetical protein
VTRPRYDAATDPHASDGVLLALHDAEHDPGLDASRAHVEQCDTCRSRLAGVAADASRVRSALASIPIPYVTEDAFGHRLAATRSRTARRVWSRPSWLAAAAVLVLAGIAAAGPIRDWLRRRAERPTIDSRSAPPPVPPESVVTTSRSGATVSFAAVGPDFIVRLDSVPDAGTLTASATSGPLVSARVANGAGTGGDDLVVLPGELRVRNTTGARASYELRLPAAVTRLRVIVAGRTIFDGPPAGAVVLGRRN